MPEITESAAESLMESVFGDAPPAPKAPAPAPGPAPVTEVEEIDAAPAPEAEEAAPVEEEGDPAPVVAEPEFEIEVNGEKEIIRGAEQVKELLQKGRDYSAKTAEVARVREALVAQHAVAEMNAKFQQYVGPDIAELKAMDAQLEQFNKIDWASAIDTDFVAVMKLQEQRTALREARNAKFQELSAKHQQFAQAEQQAGEQVLIAERKALLAKLPAWADSKVAETEKQAIGNMLRDLGFQDNELTMLTDHRAMLVARDAMKWRELQRTKVDKVKQVRDAPPVTKPGAAQQPNAKAAHAKEVTDFRKAGRSGNHRAQETSLERMLNRTFK